MNSISPTAFKARIETLYLAYHPREISPHGCQVWFSEVSGLSKKTIYSYTQGNREIDGPVVSLIECMEREQGDVLRFHEMRRADHHQRKQARRQRRAERAAKNAQAESVASTVHISKPEPGGEE